MPTPTGSQLATTLSRYVVLWDSLLVERGYRVADGRVDVSVIDSIARRYLPE